MVRTIFERSQIPPDSEGSSKIGIKTVANINLVHELICPGNRASLRSGLNQINLRDTQNPRNLVIISSVQVHGRGTPFFKCEKSEWNTVRCRYNAVNFLQISHNRHLRTHPWGCLLWIQIGIQPHSTVTTVPLVDVAGVRQGDTSRQVIFFCF